MAHPDAYANPENPAIPFGVCHATSHATAQNGSETGEEKWHKSDTVCSPGVLGFEDGENENPGALAGATGAELHGSRITGEYTLNRRAAAMALADAAADCPSEIRARLLERLLDQFRPAWPIPAFMGRVMDEARFWADMASRAELKAYALACWEQMPTQDRQAFIEHLAKQAAA